jgi:hypothetical protein
MNPSVNSVNPLERISTELSATARTICSAAALSFLIAALLLLVGSTGVTLVVTGTWPTPDVWALCAGIALVGGTLVYHMVGGLLLLLARARLRGMSQVVGLLLGMMPSGDKIQQLLQGVVGPFGPSSAGIAGGSSTGGPIGAQQASWLGSEQLGSAVKPTLLLVMVLAFGLLVSGSRKKSDGRHSDYRYV